MPRGHKRKITLPTEAVTKKRKLCRSHISSPSTNGRVSVPPTRGRRASVIPTNESKNKPEIRSSQITQATSTKCKPVRVRLEEAIHSSDNYAAIKILTSCKSDDYCCQKLLNDALLRACFKGMLPTVRVLLERGASVNIKNAWYGTPLTAAVENGYLDLAKFLIEKGANVKLSSGIGNTALIIAINKQYSISVITDLIKAGADINARNQAGKTAAMMAVERYDLKSLMLLLNYGAHLEIKDLSKKTVLDYASERNILETVRLMSDNRSDLGQLLNKAIENIDKSVLRNLIESGIISLSSNNNNNDDFTSVFQNKHISSNPDNADITDADIPNGIDHDISQVIDREILDDLDNEVPSHVTVTQATIPPLCVAASKGKIEAVKMLIAAGLDVNSQVDGDRMTPLMFAAANGHTDIIKFLHSQGADINTVSILEYSALTYAIKSGHLQCVKTLVKLGASVNKKLDVYVAATENQINCLKLLFNHVDLVDLDIDILSAAVRASNYKLVKLLVDKGMDVNAINYSGESILLQSRNEQISRLLIRKGAAVNCLNTLFTEDDNEADIDGKEEAIAFLIKNGANLNEASNGDILPLIKATVRNKVNIAKVLLEGGACPDGRTSQGLTALMYAAQRDFIDMISLLLQHGASVNAHTPEGRSALMFAAMNGCEESVRLLLAHGADIRMKDNQGEDALLMTTHEDVVKLLVEAGADVNIRNNEGLTPLQLSKMTRRLSLQKTLECLGARAEGFLAFDGDNGCRDST